jgi:hypothetical protein
MSAPAVKLVLLVALVAHVVCRDAIIFGIKKASFNRIL